MRNRFFVTLTGLLLAVSLTTAQAQQDLVEAAAKNLNSTSQSERTQAVANLARLAPVARTAVPQLIKALDSDDVAFRNEVILVLGRIGPEAAAAVEPLTKILDGDSLILQHSAIHALKQIGEKAQPATDKLKALAGSPEPFLSVPAAWAVASINSGDTKLQQEMIPILVAGLSSPVEEVAFDAIYGLSEIGKPAVGAIVTAMHSDNSKIAIRCCDTLAGMHVEAAGATQAILECLGSKDPEQQWHAARALGEIGAAGKKGIVVTALATQLKNEDVSVRATAADSLGDIGPDAAAATDALVKLLSDREAVVRAAAARAIGSIGEPAKAAVPALVKALHDDEGIVTVSAAEALSSIGEPSVASIKSLLNDEHLNLLMLTVLAEMGPAGVGATDELVKLLDNDVIDLRIEAALALAGIGPAGLKQAEGALLKRLQDEKYEPRGAMAYALAKMGAKSAIPVLQKTINTDDERLKLASAWALVVLDPHNEKYATAAVPTLIGALDHEVPKIRQEAADALSLLGPAAAAAAKPLLVLYGTSDSDDIRATALYALAEVAPEHDGLLGVARQALDDPHVMTRVTAAYALGKIGKPARDTIPKLRRMLRSPADAEQTVAAWALLHIAPTRKMAKDVGQHLFGGLKHPDADIRHELVATIGRFKKQIPGAAKALKEVQQQDPDESVRAAAKQALEG